MKYEVVVEEIVAQSFEVEANSIEDAMNITSQKYKNSEFVLEPGEHVYKHMAVLIPGEDIKDEDWWAF